MLHVIQIIVNSVFWPASQKGPLIFSSVMHSSLNVHRRSVDIDQY